MKWLLIVIVTNTGYPQGGYSVAMERFESAAQCKVAAEAAAEVAKEGALSKARVRCVEIGQ